MQGSETGCSTGDSPAKLDGLSIALQQDLTDRQLQTALQVTESKHRFLVHNWDLTCVHGVAAHRRLCVRYVARLKEQCALTTDDCYHEHALPLALPSILADSLPIWCSRENL